MSDVTPLLRCEGIELSYGSVQVLFGIDLEVHEGEIVALLGTNGAGKSSLLKTVSQLARPQAGRIELAGEDITAAGPRRVAELGIVQVPGGKATFPTLSVAEHFRLGRWALTEPAAVLDDRQAEVLELFPRLGERWSQLGGDLSGGEQQQLALGLALVARPRLLVIDELSLGLSPIVVASLLDAVRRLNAAGTTVVVVEQSVNIACTLAQRAYFLEKGQVRWSGPTEELLERDDVLRSVFLAGAAVSDAQRAPKRAARLAAAPADEAPLPALSVRGLSKRFGGVTAVSDVDLDVAPGASLGLIGANGAGKTTVLDLVSGALEADSGTVHLGALDVSGWSTARRARAGLGRSFQDARLFPSLTVAENLALGLDRHLPVRDHLAAVLDLPAIQEQEADVDLTVEELLELLQLGPHRNHLVRELSTGTRRVVDLAMALGHRADVLLLDEPSAGIAQRETEALAPLLHRIRTEVGCALVVIDHDMALLAAVADELLALDLGRVLTRGTPQEVLADPRVIEAYLGGDPATIGRSGARAAAGPAAKPRRTRRAKEEAS